jgi:hypothetical protein
MIKRVACLAWPSQMQTFATGGSGSIPLKNSTLVRRISGPDSTGMGFIGSDVRAYLQSQSLNRNQVVTYIPTTPQQDAAIIDFFKQFPDRNGVGIVDNCAARTSEALHAGKIPVQGSIFPGDLSRQAGMVPGATQFFIPQDGPIPQALLNLLPAFTKH